jgi:hypothetical protein
MGNKNWKILKSMQYQYFCNPLLQQNANLHAARTQNNNECFAAASKYSKTINNPKPIPILAINRRGKKNPPILLIQTIQQGKKAKFLTDRGT